MSTCKASESISLFFRDSTFSNETHFGEIVSAQDSAISTCITIGMFSVDLAKKTKTKKYATVT
jgi:hypothetical protein